MRVFEDTRERLSSKRMFGISRKRERERESERERERERRRRIEKGRKTS